MMNYYFGISCLTTQNVFLGVCIRDLTNMIKHTKALLPNGVSSFLRGNA